MSTTLISPETAAFLFVLALGTAAALRLVALLIFRVGIEFISVGVELFVVVDQLVPRSSRSTPTVRRFITAPTAIFSVN